MQRSLFPNINSKGVWKDRIIPENTHVAKVEMMTRKDTSILWAFKFLGAD